MATKLRKRYGQHLLTDRSVIENIINVVRPNSDQNICEIGPGKGAITFPLLKIAKKLHAIEIDRDLVRFLEKNSHEFGELTIHQMDALNFDFNTISTQANTIRLIGNLPYNISTPLLFHLLKFSDKIIDIHFMLQKEVVDRITASIDTSNYSRLSVMMQANYNAISLFDIRPDQFNPPPKVDSSFMRLVPRDEYKSQIKNSTLFSKLVETAFQQRRKTIKNSLSKLVNEKQLLNAQILPSQRPQEISIQQYINLSNEL